MKKLNIDPKTELIQRKFKKRVKTEQNNKKSNNISEDYGYETFQSMKKMDINSSPFEDIYLGSGEMEDQIQSYKEQLIDAKLKNIKLTNEVQKLKELSKTQMTKFYNPNLNKLENNEESQESSNNNNEKIKEKYEKKLSKYHDKIKALKDHNTKLEDLVLKLKDTLDRANEVFPNFLMKLSNSNNTNNDNNIDINNNNNDNMDNKKQNPLMVSVGEDPINFESLNLANDDDGQHINYAEFS